MEVIAVLLAVLFAGLAALHIYWAFGGKLGLTAALPEVDGAPLFNPGIVATLAVAFALAGFSLVALLLGFGAGSATHLMPSVVYLGLGIGGVLVLRSIGDFRYVGFFKNVWGSTFATYDSWLFSPFCLLAGGAFIALAALNP